jgi:hypothetical protein
LRRPAGGHRELLTSPRRHSGVSEGQAGVLGQEEEEQAGGHQGEGLPLHLTSQDMLGAQQYMFHRGHPPLLAWVAGVMQRCHSPPRPVQHAMTSGAVRCCAWLWGRGRLMVAVTIRIQHAIYMPKFRSSNIVAI